MALLAQQQTPLADAQHKALSRMLQLQTHDEGRPSRADTSTWKILVFDRFAQDVIAPQLKVGALRSMGVTLHVPLASQRSPVPDVAALYLVEPTEASVDRIAEDCRQNLYSTYAVNFSSSCPAELLQRLAKGLAGTSANVLQVVDRFTSYICVAPRLFSLQIPGAYQSIHAPSTPDAALEALVARVADGIVSVCVTLRSCPVIRCAPEGAAEMVARRVEHQIRELLKHPQAGEVFLPSHAPRMCMILLDRDVDLGVMLQHTWTYQAMCHDVLGLKSSRLEVPVEAEGGGPPKLKSYDVEWTDSFFASHAGNPFPVVAEAVHEQIELFEKKRAQMNQEPLDADQAIGAAMNALPEMTEKKRGIDMHTNIATALLAEIKGRSIDRYIELENDLGSKSLSSLISEVVKVVQDPQKGRSLDKARLVLSVLLARREITDEQRKTLTDALEAVQADLRPFGYLKHLASMKRMTAAMKTGMQSTPTKSSVASSLLGDQMGGLAGKLAGRVAGAVGSGVAAGLQGIKMVMPSKGDLVVTQIVDALLDSRESALTEGYLYLDPRPTGDARAQNLKAATVFVVGGGNYVEGHTVLEWAAKNGVQATYGATEMVSPEAFHDELAGLA